MNEHNSHQSSDKRPLFSAPAVEYRIGDYARYMGVTPDFLKHYEQFRIVSSSTRKNGYRYYSFGQSHKIFEAMRLRNYGLSLREIDATLIDDNADEVMEKLDERAEQIERRIQFEQAVLDEHKRLHAWYERIKTCGEDWFVEQAEDMLFLPHTSMRSFLKDERIYEILDSWLTFMPMVKSCMRIPAGSAEASSAFSWGLIVSASMAEAFQLPINEAVIRLPARKMLFYHFAGKSWAELDPENPQRNVLHKMLKQLGLSPAGDIYLTMYMYTQVNSESIRYGVYCVPIE